MKSKHFLKKQIILLIVVSFLGLVISGCDRSGSNTNTSSSGNVCTENISVNNTAEAVLYYPCNISAPAAATTMTGGTAETYASVEWMSKAVAKAGYVALGFTPANNMGLVSQWSNGHVAAIAKLKELNSSHSVLRGKIRTDALQACGHSKGGGAALHVAGQLGNQVKSAIGLAPYHRNEYPLEVLSRATAATLIQSAGDKDKNAPPSMTRSQYDSLPTNLSKAYHRFPDFGHMAWAAIKTDYHNRISRDIIAWMKYYLDNDFSQARYIEDASQKDVNIWNK